MPLNEMIPSFLGKLGESDLKDYDLLPKLKD